MDISLVIPVYNEEESLPPLVKWITDTVNPLGYEYEIIFVDDGSSDASWRVIKSLHDQHQNIKAIKLRRNYGKAAALDRGFHLSSGDVVITMDADLQDSPEEIKGLYDMIAVENYDLVSGWKKKRHDPWTKTVPSKLFNAVARKVSGLELHDFNCGLKAYKNEVVKEINVYGDMHRWIPILAKWQGYQNIGEKVVAHRAREYGVSKFGAKRLISGFLDLLSIFFVGKFNKRPMHFFGTLGIISLFIGFLILIYLTVSKFAYNVSGIQDRPLFFFGILSFIVGTQLFLTGFLAELIIDSKGEPIKYNIAEILD